MRQRKSSLPILLAAMVSAPVLLSTAAEAKCTRLGFSVNDYGKEGPTKDAKQLLDKYIARWAAERGIKKYTTGPKKVTCELYLNLIVFDEHTCRAEADVCFAGKDIPPVIAKKPEDSKAKSETAAKEKDPASETAKPAKSEDKPDVAKAEPKTDTKPDDASKPQPKATEAEKPAEEKKPVAEKADKLKTAPKETGSISPPKQEAKPVVEEEFNPPPPPNREPYERDYGGSR